MSDRKRHRLLLPEPVPLDRFAAAGDLRVAIPAWHDWSSTERRYSAHTLAAYGRDLAAFFDFLAEHIGTVPDLAALDTGDHARHARCQRFRGVSAQQPRAN